MNKRLYSDETIAAGKKENYLNNNSNNSANKEVDNILNAKSATADKNTNSNKITVSTFYTKDKNGSSNTASLYAEKQAAEEAKRMERLKRLEIKTEPSESGINNQDETPNTQTRKVFTNVSASEKASLKKSSKANLSEDAGLIVSNSDNKIISKKGIGKNKNTKANIDGNNNTDNSASLVVVAENSVNENDVTIPITEPIRKIETEPLTASIVPVKIQQSPIPGRDVLRSMVTPEKLEKLDLDIESQAAGINDMNPAKEKMLKNLKQFAGYDINKGFHIGAFISINNIWLNKRQYSADENTTSIKPKVQFGKAYGLNIGYDYSDRWGIALEWQISEQGQKYSVTQSGDNDKHIKDVNLMYTKFPLMLKYKQTFINNYNSKPIALSFLFGPQFGFLIKKNIQLDGEKLDNTTEYNKAEFGIMGGFDFDLFMTRNIALTIGGRTGFGTSMRIGTPMSFQLGVTTQLNFRFPKKIK